MSLLLTRWTFAAPYPLALLQKNGRIVWCNAAAMRLIQGASPLMLRNGLLTTRHAASTAALRTWLRNLDDQPSFHVVASEGAANNLVMQAFAVKGAVEDAVGCRMRASNARPEVADLTTGLGLTPAQAGIVRRIILGADMETISADAGLSITTVRTHLRNIYARLHISSRDELFRMCLPYVFADEAEQPEGPAAPPASPVQRKSWSHRFIRQNRGHR